MSVRKMYSNRKDPSREIVFSGETLKLVECSQPILGGECDLYTGFIDKNGNTVYVQNGTVLSRQGILRLFNKEEIIIEVKQEGNLNSCMDYHQDTISFLGKDKRPIEVKYSDKFNVLS